MLPLTWSMAAPQPLYKATFPSLALKKQKEHKVNKSLLIWAALKMLPGGRWQQLPAPCLSLVLHLWSGQNEHRLPSPCRRWHLIIT